MSYLLDPGTPGVTPGTGLYVSTDQHLPVDELRTSGGVATNSIFPVYSLSTRGRQLKSFWFQDIFTSRKAGQHVLLVQVQGQVQVTCSFWETW